MATTLPEASAHRGVAGQSAWQRYLELLDDWAAGARGAAGRPDAPAEPRPPALSKPLGAGLRAYLVWGVGAACAVIVPLFLMVACATLSGGSPQSWLGAVVFAAVLGVPLGLGVGLPLAYRRYRREGRARLQWAFYRDRRRSYEADVERHPARVEAWQAAHAGWVAHGRQVEQVRQAAVHDFQGDRVRAAVPLWVTNWARGAVGERGTEQLLRQLSTAALPTGAEEGAPDELDTASSSPPPTTPSAAPQPLPASTVLNDEADARAPRPVSDPAKAVVRTRCHEVRLTGTERLDQTGGRPPAAGQRVFYFAARYSPLAGVCSRLDELRSTPQLTVVAGDARLTLPVVRSTDDRRVLASVPDVPDARPGGGRQLTAARPGDWAADRRRVGRRRGGPERDVRR